MIATIVVTSAIAVSSFFLGTSMSTEEPKRAPIEVVEVSKK